MAVCTAQTQQKGKGVVGVVNNIPHLIVTPHAGRPVLLCLRPHPATHMLQHLPNSCAVPTTPLTTCCQPTTVKAVTEAVTENSDPSS